MTSSSSPGHLETFYRWSLTSEGSHCLRDYLHLPPEIVPDVPATLKRLDPRETRPEGGLEEEWIRETKPCWWPMLCSNGGQRRQHAKEDFNNAVIDITSIVDVRSLRVLCWVEAQRDRGRASWGHPRTYWRSFCQIVLKIQNKPKDDIYVVSLVFLSGWPACPSAANYGPERYTAS